MGDEPDWILTVIIVAQRDDGGFTSPKGRMTVFASGGIELQLLSIPFREMCLCTSTLGYVNPKKPTLSASPAGTAPASTFLFWTIRRLCRQP